MDINLVRELLVDHKKLKKCKQGLIIRCTGLTIQTIKVHEIEKKQKKNLQQKINKKKKTRNYIYNVR